MIDREARNRMAELLRHLASGTVTGKDLIDACPADCQDEAVAKAYYLGAEITGRAYGNVDFDVLRGELPLPTDLELLGMRPSRMHPPSAADKRNLSRMIMFLKSDREFDFDRNNRAGTPLRWWQALFLAPVILFGCIICAAVWCAVAAETNLWVPLIAFSALASYVGWMLHNRWWPFWRRADFEAALKEPKLLNGPKHSH